MKYLFKSKRLMVTVLLAILTPVLQQLGIPPETLAWIAGLGATYVAGETVRPSGTARWGRIWNDELAVGKPDKLD
jgi:hypothetical protein